jgi:hypothetical protein
MIQNISVSDNMCHFYHTGRSASVIRRRLRDASKDGSLSYSKQHSGT